MYIAKALDIEISKRGIKKNVFYKRSKITSSAFSQWNTGKSCATLAKVQSAADALGITIESILPNDCDLKTKTPASAMGDEELKFALFGDSDVMTDEDLQAVKSYAQFLKSKKESK